jgi:hypothetical protein
MERNMRFIRELLKWIEKSKFTYPEGKKFRDIRINPIIDFLKKYDEDVYCYNLDLLHKDGFITYSIKDFSDVQGLHETINLTWKGHNLLDAMRFIEADPEKEKDLIYLIN